jgi:hypothetical protein
MAAPIGNDIPDKQEVFQKRLGSVAPQICSYCEWRGKCEISLIAGRWRHCLRDQQLVTGGPLALVYDERGITHDMILKIGQGHFLGPPCWSLECWKLSDEWIGKANWDLHFFFSSCMKKRLTRSKLTSCTYDENYHANDFFINYNLFIIINKPLNRLHPIPIRSQLHE